MGGIVDAVGVVSANSGPNKVDPADMSEVVKYVSGRVIHTLKDFR
jgi:hypothetical protein